jgi:hypothetical protein
MINVLYIQGATRPTGPLPPLVARRRVSIQTTVLVGPASSVIHGLYAALECAPQNVPIFGGKHSSLAHLCTAGESQCSDLRRSLSCRSSIATDCTPG